MKGYIITGVITLILLIIAIAVTTLVDKAEDNSRHIWNIKITERELCLEKGFTDKRVYVRDGVYCTKRENGTDETFFISDKEIEEENNRRNKEEE